MAIPFERYRELPAATLAGKIVIDALNCYPGGDGQIPELEDGDTTSSELLAAHLPDATVVKAFTRCTGSCSATEVGRVEGTIG